MTASPGDLPDWTFAQNTIVTSTDVGTISAGSNTGQPSLNSTGLIFAFEAVNADDPINIAIGWGFGGSAPVASAYDFFSCYSDLLILATLTVETPAYGDFWSVQNLGNVDTKFGVFGASRVVDRVTLLRTPNALTNFVYGGALINGTPQQLHGANGTDAYYVSNGLATINALSDTPGTVSAAYLDFFGNIVTVDLFTVTAGVAGSVTAALPQTGMQFRFTPSTDNATATVDLFAFPAAP